VIRHRRIRLPCGRLIFGRRGELSSSPDDKIDSNTNNRRYPLRSNPNVFLVPPLHTDRRIRNNLVSTTTSDASTTMSTGQPSFDVPPDPAVQASVADTLLTILTQLTTINKRLEIQSEAISLHDRLWMAAPAQGGLHGHLIRPLRRPTPLTMGTRQPMGLAMGPTVTQPASSATHTNKSSGMTSVTRFTGRSSIFLDMMVRRIRCRG
jgi:hypothetical protein